MCVLSAHGAGVQFSSLSSLLWPGTQRSLWPSLDRTPSSGAKLSGLQPLCRPSPMHYSARGPGQYKVNSYSRECMCCLLHSEVSSQKLCEYIWMLNFQCQHVAQVNWDPSDIMCMSQCEEPGDKFAQSIYVQDLT